ESAYIAAIKSTLLRRACVKRSFTLSDEKLAAEWHRRGIPINRIIRAIHLGIVRKLIQTLNQGLAPPSTFQWTSNSEPGVLITSLQYFTQLIDEAEELEQTVPAYFGHIERKIEELEAKFTNGLKTLHEDTRYGPRNAR